MIDKRNDHAEAGPQPLRSLLAAIVDSSDDAIISKDLYGVVTSWNRAAERIFGYTAGEMVGRPISLLAAPGHDEDFRDILKKVRRGERVHHYETVRRAKDGHLVNVSLSVSPVRDEHGAVVGAAKIARDVTEQRRNDGRVLAILESVRDGLLVLDRRWTFVGINPEAARYLGREPGDLLGKNVWEELPQLLGTPAEEHVRRAMAKQVATSFEMTTPGSGRWFRVDVHPSSEGLILYGRDIHNLKQAEADVVDSRERYRALASATSDAIAMHENGTVLDLNDMFIKMFGYEASEMIGQNAFEKLVAPESLPTVERHVRSGLDEPYEATLRRKDGSTLIAQIQGRTITYQGRSVRVASAHDITERKRAEQAVKAAEEQLRLITDTVPVCISYVGPDYRYRLLNHAYEVWFGKPREMLVGQHMSEVLGDQAWAIVGPWMERAFAGETVDYETEVQYRDGGPRWIHATYTPDRGERGEVRGVVVLVTDINDRKRSESARHESETRLSLALSAARMMAWECDIQTGYTVCSEEGEQLWGFREGGGQDFLKQIHPEDAPMLTRRWQEAIDRGHDYMAEYRVQRPGEERWYATRGRIIPRDKGTDRLVGVTSDITVLKRAEQALRDADRRKDEFLAMLAHELRNPLSAISSGVQLMRLVGPDPQENARTLDVIGRQVWHLSRMIDDLTDVSRITRRKIQLRKHPVDAATVIQEAVEAARPLIEERKHRLTVTLPHEPLGLEADPTRLEQVVSNLLVNAAKYTEAGGNIWLTAERIGETVRITVRDTGMGIPPDRLHEMFELFVQGDRTLARSEGGLGIGLTLVKSLVQLHGGTVEAASEGPGKGSEFTIRLPARTPGELRSPGLGIEATAGQAPHRRVLVVDDNEDTARMLGRFLKLLGHEVRVTHSGPEAVEAAPSFQPEIVLLDIGLPGMDGYEVARRLRRNETTDRATLIAISGYGQEEDRKRSREAGINHHLVKPIEHDNLVNLMNAHGNPSS